MKSPNSFCCQISVTSSGESVYVATEAFMNFWLYITFCAVAIQRASCMACGEWVYFIFCAVSQKLKRILTWKFERQ